MSRTAVSLAAGALICAAAAEGCGVGAGESAEGEANLRVTRDFGADELVDATRRDPTESDTVMRFLDDEADVEASYGGNFVDSIDGLAGSTISSGPEDWFFFVNGIYSDIGAGEARVHPGDRIWWDYRRWAEAYRVPAVVGSWPEPFLHGTGSGPPDVVVECVGREPATADACGRVLDSLRAEGVAATPEDVAKPVEHADSLRVLVGPWDALRADPAALQIESGPSTSGVYADIGRCGVGYRLEIVGSDGRPRQQLLEAGLVAAVRFNDDEPTWLVTATVPAALVDAASLVNGQDLQDRYAVATDGDAPLPVPAADDLPPAELACG